QTTFHGPLHAVELHGNLRIAVAFHLEPRELLQLLVRQEVKEAPAFLRDLSGELGGRFRTDHKVELPFGYLAAFRLTDDAPAAPFDAVLVLSPLRHLAGGDGDQKTP